LLFQLAQATRRIRKDASEGPEGNRGQGESYYLSIYIIHNSRNESRKVENANAATGPDYDHCHCHPATHGMLQHAAEHLLRLLPPGYVHARRRMETGGCPGRLARERRPAVPAATLLKLFDIKFT